MLIRNELFQSHFISHFGFEGGTLVLIASVPGHCLSFTKIKIYLPKWALTFTKVLKHGQKSLCGETESILILCVTLPCIYIYNSIT